MCLAYSADRYSFIHIELLYSTPSENTQRRYASIILVYYPQAFYRHGGLEALKAAVNTLCFSIED